MAKSIADVWTDDEKQQNVVFTLYGMAAQFAQHFEIALAEFLSTYNRLCNKYLKISDFDRYDDKLQTKTMGNLLKDMRKYVTIEYEKGDKLLTEAVVSRNFLMHRFFREREAKLETEVGRDELYQELLSIGRTFQFAGIMTRAMHIAMKRVLGDPETDNEPEVSETRMARLSMTLDLSDDG